MKRQRFFAAVLFLALLLAASAPVLAQLAVGAQPGYNLGWWTAGGSGVSAGGAYALGGTVGQPDAGALSGGGYTLVGGFWGGAGPCCRAHLPVVMRRP